jgi:hypothetical protein
LSADLYKIYISNLLNQIENSGIGEKIWNFNCAAPTCADDVAILCDSPQDLQIIINMAYNYSCTERYKLQPTKSVILPIYPDRREIQLVEVSILLVLPFVYFHRWSPGHLV